MLFYKWNFIFTNPLSANKNNKDNTHACIFARSFFIRSVESKFTIEPFAQQLRTTQEHKESDEQTNNINNNSQGALLRALLIYTSFYSNAEMLLNALADLGV